MLYYNISTLADIVKAKHHISHDQLIHNICIHTDHIVDSKHSLFAALPGKISDGHHYIDIALGKGVTNFIISNPEFEANLKDCNYLLVDNVIKSLQDIAAHHRDQFTDLNVLGITGSNGKTVVKEWLYQLLFSELNIVKSPKSYNSQIGVPLSLFNIDRHHELGVFEAGISKVEEMAQHARTIKPTIGIFTNIGDAHSVGFSSIQEKLEEKLLLFANTKLIIYCKDQNEVSSAIERAFPKSRLLSWGYNTEADIILKGDHSTFELNYGEIQMSFDLPFHDRASIENIMHCIAFMLSQNISLGGIEEKIKMLSAIEMRLEMKEGLQSSLLINDAYSADISGLSIALDFLQKQADGRQKVVIMSALDQAGMTEVEVLTQIEKVIKSYGIQECYYISSIDQKLAPERFTIIKNKAKLLEQLHLLKIKDKAILVKGARKEKLEEVVWKLTHKGHSTRLTINLDALEHNIRVYRSLIKKDTGIIAVIKAAAYGSGSTEVAKVLSRSGIEYIAVAFVDEAIALRKSGVQMSIIVFNADLMSMQDVVQYNLELEVYTKEQIEMLTKYTADTNSTINIHLKLDTGMHRLGFTNEMLESVCSLLEKGPSIKVSTIFSHLASSEDAKDDDYTRMQVDTFERMYAFICGRLNIRPRRHILNSSGISRHPEYQYDLVRLGLGMYGLDSGNIVSDKLRKVHTLKSTLIQIKQLAAGSSVGYNRKTILTKDTLAGVVNIGYADGLMRNLGNRKYAVSIGGKLAEIIGTVSMDLIIIDLSEIDVPKLGMEVTIFDENHTLESLALAASTIPYEILSRISERVTRVYISQ